MLCMLSLTQLGATPVPGFEDAPLRLTPSEHAHLEPRASWTAADYASAAHTAASLDVLDRALLYLHRAATASIGFDHWLSFGTALVALASSESLYTLAEDDNLMRRFAADALSNAARGFLRQCPPMPTNDCAKTRALARDVLAELVVHCDNADGALWDRCPEEYLAPLRSAVLPDWPSDDRAHNLLFTPDPPCEVARRSWPELTPEAFEVEYNQPGKPVIVSNLTEGWPAKAWTDASGNEHWLYLRTAQSIVRSLMRRAHDLSPYDPRQPASNAASIFGVASFRGGKLDNQYINRPSRQTRTRETSAMLLGYS